jgi:hypothetical protein
MNLRSGSTNYISSANNLYTTLIISGDATNAADTQYLRASHPFSTTLAAYQTKTINSDLYFTNSLLSNLNSSKQVR